MGFELLKRFHAEVFESLLVLDVSTAFDSLSRIIAQSPDQVSCRVTFYTRFFYYVVLAERTAMTLAAPRPPFPVLAYTRAAAIDALIRPFPVLAFHANPRHGGADTATARPEQPRCPKKSRFSRVDISWFEGDKRLWWSS